MSIFEYLIHSTVNLHAQYKVTLNTTHYAIFKRPDLLKNMVKLLVTPHACVFIRLVRMYHTCNKHAIL